MHYSTDALIPGSVDGKWHPKFYQFLGVDPATLTPDQRMALAESLKAAYDGAVSYLEINNWQPPK